MRFPLFILFITTALLIIPHAIAFEENDCFEHYEFSVGLTWEDFYPDKVSYSPGDEVIISYKTKSVMKAPIVDGRERVQIFYNHPERGEEMVDEFFVDGDLNLMENDVVRREFTWLIPQGSPDGKYTAKIYFIVGDMFNLAGLSIVPYGPPGVPGEILSFNVENKEESFVYFDKAQTTLNSEPHLFSNFVPSLDVSEAFMHTTIGNVGNQKTVKVTAEIYRWDDLSGIPISQEEKILEIASDGT
ncbi:MAG: hypothetical protein ABIH90_02210, partial [Candidatus Aenigmatarchaeota archaeon]